ncbi:ATP-binding cassette domain-containing protein [Vibrio harveyi]|nr:ATP-binding cassette domain-containing protein [Vibrio harveyi]
MDIQNLNFYYNKGSDAALKSVSMPIYKNRVTALIGPSGCGKSTLLRTLNRIYMTCMGISTLKAKSYLMVRASLAIRTSMNCVPKWAWFSKNQRHFPCRYTKTWHLD